MSTNQRAHEVMREHVKGGTLPEIHDILKTHGVIDDDPDMTRTRQLIRSYNRHCERTGDFGHTLYRFRGKTGAK